MTSSKTKTAEPTGSAAQEQDLERTILHATPPVHGNNTLGACYAE